VSGTVQTVMEQVRALPPDELQEVATQISELQARRHGWEEQKTRLREMQGRHAGRGLLNRLLEERAKERARD